MNHSFAGGIALLIWAIPHLTVAQSSSVDLARGLVASYPFNRQLLTSETGRGPTMVPKGTRWTQNRFGLDSTAWAFDGVDQELLLPYDPTLDLGDAYTVSVWIKPRDQNQGCILLKEGDYGLKWNGLNKPLTLFDGFQGGFPNGAFTNWSSQEWYHLALVRDGERLRLYVNGREDCVHPARRKEQVPPKNLYLGKHPYLWGGFTGAIDDLALYARALHPTEIMTLTQIENLPRQSFGSTVGPPVKLETFLGLWQGVITQPEHVLVPNYTFWLYFREIEEGRLVGYSRIEVPEDDAFGVIQVQAIVSGGSLSFEEIRIYRQKNFLGYKWCKKFGQVRYLAEDDALKGRWYANNCGDNGEVLLYKSEGEFNYFDNRLSKPVSVEELVNRLEAGERPAEQDLSLQVQPISFAFGTAQLDASSQQYLRDELLSLLERYPRVRLTIKGYTDASGDDAVNLQLSKRRAQAIRTFLIEQGIAAKRVQAQGYGEANPIASNATAQGRERNRRVEFNLDF